MTRDGGGGNQASGIAPSFRFELVSIFPEFGCTNSYSRNTAVDCSVQFVDCALFAGVVMEELFLASGIGCQAAAASSCVGDRIHDRGLRADLPGKQGPQRSVALGPADSNSARSFVFAGLRESKPQVPIVA